MVSRAVNYSPPGRPAAPLATTYASKRREVVFLAGDGTLVDSAGAFRFAGWQADGMSATPAQFEAANTVLTNPAGGTHNMVQVNGRSGGGVAGMLEFVTDLQNGSSQMPMAQRKALRMVVDGSHIVTSNHGRNQITTPPLTPYVTQRVRLSVRWDTTNNAAEYAPASTFMPPFDQMHNVLVFQLHQYHSVTPFEANQVTGGVPPISLHYICGRWNIRIRRLNEICGGTATNGASQTYRAFDKEDNQRGHDYCVEQKDPTQYIDFEFEFILDEREAGAGGRGYFKARAGGEEFCDYVGPTLHPRRGAGDIVEVAAKFGQYCYNTPYEASLTKTLAQSIIDHATPLNPFKTTALYVREYRQWTGA